MKPTIMVSLVLIATPVVAEVPPQLGTECMHEIGDTDCELALNVDGNDPDDWQGCPQLCDPVSGCARFDQAGDMTHHGATVEKAKDFGKIWPDYWFVAQDNDVIFGFQIEQQEIMLCTVNKTCECELAVDANGNDIWVCAPTVDSALIQRNEVIKNIITGLFPCVDVANWDDALNEEPQDEPGDPFASDDGQDEEQDDGDYYTSTYPE